ncbi:MAG: hypothetical protein COA38_13730 [Fluviicola sp.]|nr:MAG: hypothetical protein COA38_13730 [Fluviicola sp.]
MSITFKSFSLIGLIFIFSACTGLSQPENEETRNDKPIIGRTIKKLETGVSRIFQDSQDNYWFASNGLIRYNGETLTRFTTEDGLYSNRIRDIQEDHLGNIYFDTGEGINKFDGKTIEKLEVIDDRLKARKLEVNDLWFVGDWNSNGVYRYDGQNLYQLKLPKHTLEEEFKRINPHGSFDPYSSYTTFRDKTGNIWFGGCTFGACRFNGSSFLWISEREMTEVDPGPAIGVRSILQDLDGNFYFSSDLTSKYTIVNYDGVDTYEKLDGMKSAQETDRPSSCMSIVQDDEGNFWMANYRGGVWKYDGEEFTHYPILLNNKEVDLFSIYKDRQGILWLGTHNAGVYKFNGEDFERFEPKLTKR